MVNGVTNSDSIPVLERLMQFAGQRHRLIAHNIANLDTPNFRPVDVSVDQFQTQLREAVDRRRAEGPSSAFRLAESSEVQVNEDGLELHPAPAGQNILFHDGNDRNVERVMQDLVENFMTFRAASQLLKSRFDIINTAIRQRL